MAEDKAIILALIRCSMANNPNDAVKHQIHRLCTYYTGRDNAFVQKINDILYPPECDYPDFKIVKS